VVLRLQASQKLKAAMEAEEQARIAQQQQLMESFKGMGAKQR
jgi:hypothetical protein